MSDVEMHQLRRSERIASIVNKKEMSKNEQTNKDGKKVKTISKKIPVPKVKKEKMKIDKKLKKKNKVSIKPVEIMKINDIFSLIRKYAYNITEKTIKYNILKSTLKYKGLVGITNNAKEFIEKNSQIASLISQKGVLANDNLLRFTEIEEHIQEILDYPELQLNISIESVNTSTTMDIDNITNAFQRVEVSPNCENLIDILSKVYIK
jgi:hypothetical protein